MSEHTKEPWFVPAEKPTSIVVEGTEIACGLREKDARRIVACVNACAGIPDNVLEKAAECAASGRFGTMAAMYKAQRYELLEVVKYTRQVLPQDIWANDLKVMLDTAIANAEKYDHGAANES